MKDTKFISIFHPYDSTQAGFIREALEQADIVCYVNNENLSSVGMGGIGFGMGRMTVMVPENQGEQAIEIIRGLGIE